MAVQAQCSSNILLNRNILQDQIGNKYNSLPSQPVCDDGLPTNLLDHHHHSFNHSLFNNNNNNFQVGNCNTTSQRNKERQDNTMNQFMSNIQQQQFMDVSQQQYQSRSNIDVSTGLQLAFNDHHQQQHSYDHHLFSQDLSTLINQQANEIQHYLQTQGEEFRRKLAEKRHRHYHALIGAANESATRMMKEKEMEAEKAARRHAELSARASQLSAEAEVWQARARAQEAVAAALQVQLQQAACVSNGEEVAAREAEDAESSYIDPERVVVVSGPGCKACGKRVASVVLLPCRHLCVCSECDDVVQACPLCLSIRSSTIHVYMS